MKLWGGRFETGEAEIMEEFDNSLPVGTRIYEEDIVGSIAHVHMLGKCKIISTEDADKIATGLQEILDDIENGVLRIEDDDNHYEDIHSFVESKLIDRIGQVGKKMHTARSRNDQVALDNKLYARKTGKILLQNIEKLMGALKERSEAEEILIPGYTHLQRAQVVTVKHYLLAYYEMLHRDHKRIESALSIANESPLGAGALAGTTHELDRQMTAKELHFDKPVNNFLDGVSDRDYFLELMFDCSMVMMHLSRLSEELILWSSQEFGFVRIADAFSTGSSMMPQKKNPDSAELIRGKSGSVYGSLFGLMTTMKGLPLAYNKDMQEDKESFYAATDNTIISLKVMQGIISTLTYNKERILKALRGGFLNATEVADYLVKKGVPFRDAHDIVGHIVLFCEQEGIAIEDMTLEQMKTFSDVIQADIFDYIDYKQILQKGIKQEML